MKSSSIILYSLYILLASIIIFLFSYKMGQLPIILWDESRLAINAYEMYKNGWSLITTFYNEIDLWNTKPPLVIWLEAFSMKLFGLSVYSFRLPAIITSIILSLSLGLWTKKIINNYFIGLLAGFILATNLEFNTQHISRTGDYDIFLCLFMLIYAMCYYLFLNSSKAKYIYLTWLFIALAVLTKSVAGLMIIPGLFLFTIINKKITSVLKNPHFYLGSIIFIMLVGGYYISREIVNPGYLMKVYENELGGRYLKVLEEHQHPWYYYIMHLNTRHWNLILPFSLLGIFFIKSQVMKKFLTYNWIIAISYLLIISSSATKLLWYIAPFYVFISIPMGWLLYEIIIYLNNKLQRKNILNLKSSYTLIIITLLLIAAPFIITLNHINGFRNQFKSEEYQFSGFINKALKGEFDIKDNFAYHYYYCPQVVFYQIMANEQGYNLKDLPNDTLLEPNMKIIASDPEHKKKIEDNYNFTILNQDLNVVQYQIINKK